MRKRCALAARDGSVQRQATVGQERRGLQSGDRTLVGAGMEKTGRSGGRAGRV